MTRKFSIPYNNQGPERYLGLIEQFKDNIENIYLGYPGILNHFIDTSNTIDDLINTRKFLELSRGVYKRYITINRSFISSSDDDKTLFIVNTLEPIIYDYSIEGVIVSDFNFACILHDMIPELDIQTSCNTYQFNLQTYKYWNKEAGVTTFNPPREILRTPQLLKDVHNLGFKIKCIVNEACIYGCPQNINHSCYISVNQKGVNYYCNREDYKYSDFLKTNFILPRHLKYFDDYVDVYKIAGRSVKTGKLISIIDAYVNERNDVDLLDIVTSRIGSKFKQAGISIPVKFISDKILTCECKDCDECQICDKIIEKILK